MTTVQMHTFRIESYFSIPKSATMPILQSLIATEKVHGWNFWNARVENNNTLVIEATRTGSDPITIVIGMIIGLAALIAVAIIVKSISHSVGDIVDLQQNNITLEQGKVDTVNRILSSGLSTEEQTAAIQSLGLTGISGDIGLSGILTDVKQIALIAVVGGLAISALKR